MRLVQRNNIGSITNRMAFCVCLLLVTSTANADLVQTMPDAESVVEKTLFEETSIGDETALEDSGYTQSAKALGYSKQIADVLSGDDFGKTKYVKSWRFIDTSDEQARAEKIPEWLIKFIEWVESWDWGDSSEDSSDVNFSSIAKFLEVLLWVVAISLILLVIYKFRDDIVTIARSLKHEPNSESLPTTMFGLDIKKESLPDDVVATAREEWGKGEQRSALATLLRASLVNLLNDHGCRFYDSDTEAECCQRIDKQASKPLSQYMRLLVSAWQQVAYAHRAPSNESFDVLCKQWTEVFV